MGHPRRNLPERGCRLLGNPGSLSEINFWLGVPLAFSARGKPSDVFARHRGEAGWVVVATACC